MNPNFAQHLARYGPDRDASDVSATRAWSYCVYWARTHYENFPVVSLLLPRRLARHFYPLYAWCRWADNLADETGGGAHALTLLRWWREELERCYAGCPKHPITIALRPTIDRFGLPKQLFLDLLFAFEQDQLVHYYQTFAQLLDYCRGSANPVGRLVLYVCETFNEENAVYSDRICTALQLTNFWQDVCRDLELGRVYLPEEDRQRFGYSDTELRQRLFTVEFRELLQFQVERTRDLFYRGMPLLERVPPEIRIDIDLFVQGGLTTLRKIEEVNYNVWDFRPELSGFDKGRLLAVALWRKLQQYSIARSTSAFLS